MEAGSRIFCSRNYEIRDIISYFYAQESSEWHRSVHENGGTCEENISDTIKSTDRDSVFYVVDSENVHAAYFFTNDKWGMPVLDGFFIGVDFRKKLFFDSFWKIVKNYFKETFYAGIYMRNEQAINHMLRHGFVIDEYGNSRGMDFVRLKFINQCQ